MNFLAFSAFYRFSQEWNLNAEFFRTFYEKNMWKEGNKSLEPKLYSDD